MKVANYRQVVMCVVILLFSVTSWAKNEVQGKKTDTPTAMQQKENEGAAGEGVDINEGVSKADPQIPGTPSQDAEPGKMLSEAEYWISNVDQLIKFQGQPEQVEINALYSKLSTAFDFNSRKLENKLRGGKRGEGPHKEAPDSVGTAPYILPETKDELYHTVHTLYYQRLRLLKSESTEVLDEVTGAGVEGVEELYRELSFLRQTLLYRIDALPRLLENLLNNLSIAPLPTLGSLLQFIIAIFIFRYWRRWAPEGLMNMRRRLIKMRPRTKRNRRLTKSIWYFDQVRPPVAWFVLLALMFSFIKDPVLIFFIEVARITANWILISWFGVLFINALIARSSRSLKKETADLTLRSLRYTGIWFVFSALNLSLISRYAGEGTLYAWMFSVNEILLFFLLILLLIIWRQNILEGIENDPQKNALTEAILQHKKGLISYLYCILGAWHLLRVYITRKFIVWISDFNTGQEMLDSLLGSEIAKAYRRQKDDLGLAPIPVELKEKLLESGEVLIEQAGRAVFEKILKRVEEGSGGTIILAGETGGGKTVLLQRVARETAEKSILVSCPKEGFDALIKELARKLHIDADTPNRRIIFEKLRKRDITVLLIDNIHWLIRPYVGGQAQLDKLAELFLYNPDVLIVSSTNTATYQFILRARAKLMLDKNALILQPWSVDQIATLIRNFCKAADIDPDFSKIIIPRQFDDRNFDNPEERIFAGFIRILHGAATGNPKVALGLWTNSLCLDKEGRITVQLPRLPTPEVLDNASLTVLLVLRVICQAEVIKREDIVQSLQLSDSEVANALRISINNAWVEGMDEDYYQITWFWRKVITRVLSRQNLMPRII